MVTAHFRFYQQLNDFLPRPPRQRAFSCACARAATTKHMIEALGVPHTEVELILVNGESSGFDRLLAEGDRVAVYPKFRSLDISPLRQLRERPLREPRFIADAHLGGLARHLRMAGFDTLFDPVLDDADLATVAGREDRVVLTRDRELLKRRDIIHGCYLRALKTDRQFIEIVQRLDLTGAARPFSRCLACNAPLTSVPKAAVVHRLPESVRRRIERFSTCPVCGGVFWEGTHWARMRALLTAAGVAT